MSEDTKTRFKKETFHRGGSIPFWDMSWSARLEITTKRAKVFSTNPKPEDLIEKTVWLDTGEILELKQLLKDFDGRKGIWKRRNEK